MKRVAWKLLAFLGALCMPGAVFAQSMSYEERQSLIAVDGHELDEAWILPGADLSHYRKLQLQPATLSFDPAWQREYNRSAKSPTRRLSNTQVAQIQERTLRDFDAVFAEQLRAAGFDLVSEGGPDVLVLQPALSELWLNDPGVEGIGRSEIFVKRAGQGTLTLLLRDGSSGQLLGATVDHRPTRDHNVIRRSSPVFTQTDLRELFAVWGKGIAGDLPQLHQRPLLGQVD